MIFFDSQNPNKYNFLKKEIVPNKTSYTKKRYGGKYDGSYVFLEELLNQSQFVYSYGINSGMDAIKFDLEMAENNKIIYMYDASIEAPSYNHKNFRFNKEFVTKDNLFKHLEKNNHLNETSMVLKMDIDGNEYELFNNNIEIISRHFNQISLELHALIEEIPQGWIVDDLNLSIMKNKDIKKSFFNNVKKYYNIIHIHANNHAPRYVDFPASLEILLLRKDYEVQGIDDKRYPIENLDYPNYLGREDYVLDWWLHE
jgi:hypothetical protein